MIKAKANIVFYKFSILPLQVGYIDFEAIYILYIESVIYFFELIRSEMTQTQKPNSPNEYLFFFITNCIM